MRFRHVVMFKWGPGVGADHVDAVAERLDLLAPAIDVIRSFRHGADARVNEGNFDYVVVADFDSKDDYITYRDHSEHTAFVAEMLVGFIGSRAAVQYTVTD